MIKSIKAKIKARLRARKRKQFPSVIQLQTTSACNARCTCCPYSMVQRSAPVEHMTDELYAKIIDECSHHGIEKISLYLFNEPLLDRKIIERLKYAKAKNPGSRIRISTNAGLLTEKTSLEMADSVDFVYLSVQGGITDRDKYEEVMGLNYDKTHKNMMGFIETAKTGRHNLKISNIAINNAIPFDTEEKLEAERAFWMNKGINTLNFGGFSSWAGKLDTGRDNYSRNIRGCSLKHRPLTHVHVVENGDVILCCRDWDRECILGNLNESTIFDIWNSARYRDIVEKVYLGKKAPDNFLCYRCEDAIRL